MEKVAPISFFILFYITSYKKRSDQDSIVLLKAAVL